MPRITVYQDGSLIADSGAPTYVPPEHPPVAPPVTPTTPALPAGAMRVDWSEAGQQKRVPGSLAVHVAVPADAVGEMRVWLELSNDPFQGLPSGTLYGGVDRKEIEPGGTVKWPVRMGDVAGPGQSQGFAGTDFVLNVTQPAGQSCWFQFQWYPV